MRCLSLAVQLAALSLLGCHAGGDRIGGVPGSLHPPASLSKSWNGAPPEPSRDPAIADPASRAVAAPKKLKHDAGSSPAKADQSAVSGHRSVYPASALSPVAPDPSTYAGPNRRPFANTFIDTVNALQGDGLPLNAPAKATEPTLLFRVRGSDAMLLWRYRF